MEHPPEGPPFSRALVPCALFGCQLVEEKELKVKGKGKEEVQGNGKTIKNDEKMKKVEKSEEKSGE